MTEVLGTKDSAPLSWRLVCGALAGIVATGPMTAAMRRFHRELKVNERYPLPPREIVTSTFPGMPGEVARNTSMVAHFAYGALSGLALAALRRKPTVGFGIGGGVGIWLASYLGWVPAFGILKTADRHPATRNAGMIVSHMVWGAAFALAQTELLSSRPIVEDGSMKDRA